MIAQKTEEMDKMEIEAIAQINKRLWGNYSYAEVTPDEILRKCAITFDNKVRMNSNRENGLLIRALSRHDKIYCQFAAGKPKPIGQDRLVEALSEMDGVYLMVYQYKVPSKPKRLFVFSNYEWVEDYFINRKLALTVTYSIFDGKRDMIVKAEKPMIKANRQDQEKNKATLSNIFSGSAKKLLGIMHDLRLPHLPNTKDSAYILDTQQVEICKILPYLLTAYSIQQINCPLYNRSNAKRFALFGMGNEKERNITRDKKYIAQIASLCAFPSDQWKLMSGIIRNEVETEPRPLIIDLSREQVNQPEVICTIFQLWVFILASIEELCDKIDLEASIQLLQYRTHCFDIYPEYLSLFKIEDQQEQMDQAKRQRLAKQQIYRFIYNLVGPYEWKALLAYSNNPVVIEMFTPSKIDKHKN